VSKSCPDCGAAVELSEQEARLLTGTCPSCGKAVTVVSGVHLSVGPAEGGPAGEATPGAAGPACAECGGPLSIEIDGRSLTVSCESCDTSEKFYKSPPKEGHGRSGEREPSFDRPRGPRPEGGFRPMSSRPCRQCGAPLRFSTDDQGLLTGECDSCGNRFTLPPRSGARGGGFRAPRPEGPYGRRRDSRYGGGGGRPPRPGGRRFRPRDGADEDDERPRRRPRRE